APGGCWPTPRRRRRDPADDETCDDDAQPEGRGRGDKRRGGAMSALLEVEGVGKRFGGFVALDGVNLTVGRGERIGLIGPNGSGKSTLVNCICGTLHNETGTVRFEGKSLNGLASHQRTYRGIARSFQLPRPFV